ncbi:MerR family transcriptional regulator [Stenotrophomonas sp. BIGb0135]|uniref:MerR family transcriptional regulator n=1 Tax=Stenotrophomonas sp. BIGb0135 TaxID=2940620 RepID=UPI0021687E9D|nr:MerR family transcriptional regulator [Stenotrophomonas sp. BIGb0135]MCS4232881.1 DNA-binding transcriptional MerR regulator [Stenotrophomonas sp. BIGb0135]
MRISEVARRSGASQKAIRLYEARGLLATVARINRYRDYSEQDLNLVLLIRQALALGFRLADVAALRRADGGIDWLRVQALLAQRQQAVRADMQRLQQLDAALTQLRAEVVVLIGHGDTGPLDACMASGNCLAA